MRRIFYGVCLLVLLLSCRQNPLKVDVSEVEMDLQLKSLDSALFAAKDRLGEALPVIREEFADFLPLFTYQMIQIGGPESPEYLSQFQSFLNDTLILELKNQVDLVFPKEELADELTDAFRHYRYYFPERLVPDISYYSWMS